MAEQRYRYQARGGVERFIIFDDDQPDRFVIETRQDVEPILDSVARDRELMRNDGVNKVLGRVPVATYERAVNEQWDESDWRKWWNGEGRPFRIWKPGGDI